MENQNPSKNQEEKQQNNDDKQVQESEDYLDLNPKSEETESLFEEPTFDLDVDMGAVPSEAWFGENPEGLF